MERCRATGREAAADHPAWARSRTELVIQAKWVVSYYTHVGVYHLTRSPKYAAKLLARAPRGAFRLVTGTARWAVDAEGAPVRVAAVRRENAEEYLKLSRQRDARVRLRSALLVAATVGGSAAAGLLVLFGSHAAWYAVLVAVVAVLGVVGTPSDRPLVDTAVSSTRAPKLTSDVVLSALGAISVAGINQAISRRGLQDAIRFAEPISRDGPDGGPFSIFRRV